MIQTDVILVDELDNAIGSMEKMEAHRQAQLHRAFSVFVFNSDGEMLLQRRAANKYHSAGLWTNTCCSHPYPGEDIHAAAQRRLQEEMGFQTKLEKIFDFIYKAELENGLSEYEFDHVFTGTYDGPVQSNPEEVSDHCFKPLFEIERLLHTDPHSFTAWFRIAFPQLIAKRQVDKA
jgi:isopentenyl-diphosphate Delta-isomerase